MLRRNGFADPVSVVALVLAAAMLFAGPASGQNNTPQVAVTDLDVTDFDEGTVEIDWEISGEPEHLVGLRVGYCIRARRGTEDWTEKCADDPDTTQASVDIGKPSHCRPQGVDYNTKGEVKIHYKDDGLLNQLKTLLGIPAVDIWTEWSPTYTLSVTWRCTLSDNSELRRPG